MTKRGLNLPATWFRLPLFVRRWLDPTGQGLGETPFKKQNCRLKRGLGHDRLNFVNNRP